LNETNTKKSFDDMLTLDTQGQINWTVFLKEELL
jgi:hypothetical protein